MSAAYEILSSEYDGLERAITRKTLRQVENLALQGEVETVRPSSARTAEIDAYFTMLESIASERSHADV